MSLSRIFAQLSCASLEASLPWFTTLFGRDPDERPMAGLAEWLHGSEGGLQLFENRGDAGHGTLTLIVTGLAAERDRLDTAGLGPGGIERASTVDLIRLRDPDSNLVVLAESH